jgi:hypothetical protein
MRGFALAALCVIGMTTAARSLVDAQAAQSGEPCHLTVTGYAVCYAPAQLHELYPQLAFTPIDPTKTVRDATGLRLDQVFGVDGGVNGGQEKIKVVWYLFGNTPNQATLPQCSASSGRKFLLVVEDVPVPGTSLPITMSREGPRGGCRTGDVPTWHLGTTTAAGEIGLSVVSNLPKQSGRGSRGPRHLTRHDPSLLLYLVPLDQVSHYR